MRIADGSTPAWAHLEQTSGGSVPNHQDDGSERHQDDPTNLNNGHDQAGHEHNDAKYGRQFQGRSPTDFPLILACPSRLVIDLFATLPDYGRWRCFLSFNRTRFPAGRVGAAFQRSACRTHPSFRPATSISCPLVSDLDNQEHRTGATHAVGQITQGGGFVTR